ncbi:MAG: hypothetical protein J3R72DRAFT_452091 [Linnemannia gamsii]|nr:MAG: hypothetical protein J3R72DRAFT_452091 [Linnemannia gamsii]
MMLGHLRQLRYDAVFWSLFLSLLVFFLLFWQALIDNGLALRLRPSRVVAVVVAVLAVAVSLYNRHGVYFWSCERVYKKEKWMKGGSRERV